MYVRLLHFGNDHAAGNTGQELARMVTCTEPSARTISLPTQNPEYRIVLNSSKVFCPYSQWRPELRTCTCKEESYEKLQRMTHKQLLQSYSTVQPPRWDQWPRGHFRTQEDLARVHGYGLTSA